MQDGTKGKADSVKVRLRAPSPKEPDETVPVNGIASSTSLCSIDPGTRVATRTSGTWSAKHEGATRAHPDNWKMKVKNFSAPLNIFFRALRGLIDAPRLCNLLAVPEQLQGPGYATTA